MKIIMMSPDKLIPYSNNPRKNDKAVLGVSESIKEFGFKVPIVVDPEFVIITGHTRHKAAILLNLKEVPVIIADDLTPEQVKAFRIRDNKEHESSGWDDDKLQLEFSELLELGYDLILTGFEFEVPVLGDSAKQEKNTATQISSNADKTKKEKENFFDIPDDLNVGMPLENNSGNEAKQTKTFSIKFGKSEIFTTEQEFNDFELVLRKYLESRSNDLGFIGYLVADKLATSF